MHIQVINFRLRGISDSDYRTLCDQLAPSFRDVPGLVSKVWLARPEDQTYGGVYTWESRQAMAAFTTTELFKSVLTHPNLADIQSADYAVLAEPTRVTRGVAVAVV
jgi:heme-degrading monooxygenase HmoA